MKYGIEIFMGPALTDWVFIEATDRDQATELQRLSQDLVPTRQVVVTEEGNLVRVFATE